MKKIWIFFVFILLIFSYCKKHYQGEEEKDWSKINQTLIRVNKYLVKEDRERIESYIKRKGWHMTESPTGFWYEIYEKGNGPQAQSGWYATINYRVELLDGTLCYTSDSLGPKRFKINFANVESGLHQGIQLMHEGDKARFIFPPYLAHGLLGDENKIPPRAIIVYYVDLIKLEKPENENPKN